MIASSRRAKWAAAALAILAHAAVALSWDRAPETRSEGGAGAPEVRLGNSFADFAAGTLSAEAPLDSAEPAEPETADAVPPVEPAERPEAEIAKAPEALATLNAEPALPLPLPLPAVTPETDAAPAEISEALAPTKSNAGAPTRSLRPVRRSAAFEDRNTPPQPQPQPAPRGNADTNAAAGTAEGRESAPESRPGNTQSQSSAAGNAAASSYPGAVMRKISGTRKPRLSRSGSARVSFRIGPSGALAGAGIASSSGSPALDREALSLIQRASPFPPPPAGARTSFSIDIQFR